MEREMTTLRSALERSIERAEIAAEKVATHLSKQDKWLWAMWGGLIVIQLIVVPVLLNFIMKGSK